MIVWDMPEAEYHSDESLGSTGLKACSSSKAEFDALSVEPTSAMNIGSATHGVLLSNWVEGEHFIVIDVRTRNAKAFKEAVAPDGGVVLTAPEHEKVLKCLEMIKANPIVTRALDGARTEVSFFWEEKVGDVVIKCKGRADILTAMDSLCDLKTTSKGVGPETFDQFRRYRDLTIQFAHYRRGLRANGIDVEADACHAILAPTSAPWVPAEVHRVPPADLLEAEAIVERFILPYIARFESQPDTWPGHACTEGGEAAIIEHEPVAPWYWTKFEKLAVR